MNTAENLGHHEHEEQKKEPAEIIDLASRRAEAAKEEHPMWPITIDEHGDIHGLPDGKEPRDVIVLMGHDGKWYAQNPSTETLKEIHTWRSDWVDEIDDPNAE